MSAVILLLMGTGGSAGEDAAVYMVAGMIAFATSVGSYFLGSALKDFRPWARIVAGSLAMSTF